MIITMQLRIPQTIHWALSDPGPWTRCWLMNRTVNSYLLPVIQSWLSTASLPLSPKELKRTRIQNHIVSEFSLCSNSSTSPLCLGPHACSCLFLPWSPGLITHQGSSSAEKFCFLRCWRPWASVLGQLNLLLSFRAPTPCLPGSASTAYLQSHCCDTQMGLEIN